jgi:starch-binding outer membrane protein SusE/F
MKKYFQFLAYIVTASVLMVACKKDENRIFLQGGTAPVLTASTTAVSLTPGTEAENAISFSWTNPDYTFTTGVSSHDVVYTLELDTLGANFGSSNKYVTTIARDLGVTYTKGQLNDIMGNSMRVPTGRTYTVEARISSTLGSANAAKLSSQVVKFTANPFTPPPKVAPPVTGKLYIVGSATAGDWSNPVPVPSQEFTKISNTKYQIEVALLGGGREYLFLPLNGDWGSKYAFPENTQRNANGGKLEFRTAGGQNFLGPDAAGNYRIVVDFQLGEYTVTKI